ncbi:MAG: hypothetical protein CMJ48_14500 [Planctomycetaceae bacterium]|nr:hypothetical protein [Planctomycetaceae bacterium]
MRILLLVVLPCVLLTGVARSDERPDRSSGDLKTLYGLWRGSWGGGENDGVVFQPVKAELYIGEGRAVWQGLPMLDGTGAIRLSGGSPRSGRFTYSTMPKDKPQEKPVGFTYAIKGDTVVLDIGEDGKRVSLRRIAIEQTPFADVGVDFETARGVDREGNLLVTTYRVIRVGDRGPELHSPVSFVRPLEHAHIYRVLEHGAKRITVEEVRRLLRTPTPVVVASRSARDGRPRPDWDLSKTLGEPNPDSEAGLKTLTRLLRPGTLVFVHPEAARISSP